MPLAARRTHRVGRPGPGNRVSASETPRRLTRPARKDAPREAPSPSAQWLSPTSLSSVEESPNSAVRNPHSSPVHYSYQQPRISSVRKKPSTPLADYPHSSPQAEWKQGSERSSSEHRRIRKRSPPRGADPTDAGPLRATTTTPPLQPRRRKYKAPEYHFSRPLRGILARLREWTAIKVDSRRYCPIRRRTARPRERSPNNVEGLLLDRFRPRRTRYHRYWHPEWCSVPQAERRSYYLVLQRDDIGDDLFSGSPQAEP